MDQKLRNRSWDKVEKKLRHSEHPYCRHPNIKYLVCMGSVMTQIFLWYTMDVQSDSRHLTPCDGCGICSLSDTSCPTQLSVPMFSLLLQLSYFSDILRTSDAAWWLWCLFIFRHLAPNLAKCSYVFPFVMTRIFLQYTTDIWLTPDVQLCTMAVAFFHYWTTRTQFGWVFWSFSFS